VCPVCHYTLTEDEYKEGLEEDRKLKESKRPKRHKPSPVIKPQVIKNPKITPENASEVTIIRDTSKTVTPTGEVSSSRFLGYLLLLLADASFVLGAWYLWFNISIVMGLIFVLVSVAFVFVGISIIKSAGVDAKFIKKNSITTSILGLLISLGAFSLLLIEMEYNNPIFIFIAIGLLILGVALFFISISAREVEHIEKK
jgi:hypothetical protein